jgi:hypothetical protein
MSKWIELNSIEAVATAKMKGWEIEIDTTGSGGWEPWNKQAWVSYQKYRGSPAQPKRIIITSLCWIWIETGEISYRIPGVRPCGLMWRRLPSNDITAEVEE